MPLPASKYEIEYFNGLCFLVSVGSRIELELIPH